LFLGFLNHGLAAIWPEGEAMSDESEISQVLDRIGRLKLGKGSTAVLAGIAIIKWGSPVNRYVRWIAAAAVGLGYWNGFFS
jgi:hypothetical protein